MSFFNGLKGKLAASMESDEEDDSMVYGGENSMSSCSHGPSTSSASSDMYSSSDESEEEWTVGGAITAMVGGSKRKMKGKKKPGKRGPLSARVTATASVRSPRNSDTVRPTRYIPSLFSFRKSVILFDDWNLPSVRGGNLILASKAKLFLSICAESSRVTRNLFRCSGFSKTESTTAWNAIWSKHIKPEKYKNLLPFQKFNHWPGTWEMGRKDRLYVNVRSMANTFGANQFDFCPKTYVLPGDVAKLMQDTPERQGGHGPNSLPDKVLIVKPCASARGKGISLAGHISQVPVRRKSVVQDYLPNPLLVKGKKFDMRLYVTMLSLDPLRIYIHQNGLARFATVPFERATPSSLDETVHITNFTIQQKSDTFVAPKSADDTDGDKWSLKGLTRWMVNEMKFDSNRVDTMWKEIDDIIIKTLLSVLTGIRSLATANVKTRGNCFELYGFDILLDDTLKPWLLEVNISPSLASPSALDKELKGKVMMDLFNMVGFLSIDPRLPSSKRMGSGNGARYSMVLKEGSLASTSSVPSSAGFDVSSLSAEDLDVLQDSEDEYSRRGDFRRIFPTPESEEKYKQYVTRWSHFDSLLSDWLRSGSHFSVLDVPLHRLRPSIPRYGGGASGMRTEISGAQNRK